MPDWSHLRQFTQMDREFKLKQKQDFDKRHRTSQLPIIPDDTPVYVETEGQRASGRVHNKKINMHKFSFSLVYYLSNIDNDNNKILELIIQHSFWRESLKTASSS